MGNTPTSSAKDTNPRTKFDQLYDDYHTLCTYLSFFTPQTGLDHTVVNTKTAAFFTKHKVADFNTFHTTYPETTTHLVNIFLTYHNAQLLNSILSKYKIVPSVLSDDVTLGSFTHLFSMDITDYVIQFALNLLHTKATGKTHIYSATDPIHSLVSPKNPTGDKELALALLHVQNNPYNRDFYVSVLNLAVLSITPANLTQHRVKLILAIYNHLNTAKVNCLMETPTRHIGFKHSDIPTLFSHLFRVFNLELHDTALFRDLLRLFTIPPSYHAPLHQQEPQQLQKDLAQAVITLSTAQATNQPTAHSNPYQPTPTSTTSTATLSFLNSTTITPRLSNTFDLLQIEKKLLNFLPVFRYPLTDPESNSNYVTLSNDIRDVRFLTNIHRTPLHAFLTQPLLVQVQLHSSSSTHFITTTSTPSLANPNENNPNNDKKAKKDRKNKSITDNTPSRYNTALMIPANTSHGEFDTDSGFFGPDSVDPSEKTEHSGGKKNSKKSQNDTEWQRGRGDSYYDRSLRYNSTLAAISRARAATKLNTKLAEQVVCRANNNEIPKHLINTSQNSLEFLPKTDPNTPYIHNSMTNSNELSTDTNFVADNNDFPHKMTQMSSHSNENDAKVSSTGADTPLQHPQQPYQSSPRGIGQPQIHLPHQKHKHHPSPHHHSSIAQQPHTTSSDHINVSNQHIGSNLGSHQRQLTISNSNLTTNHSNSVNTATTTTTTNTTSKGDSNPQQQHHLNVNQHSTSYLAAPSALTSNSDLTQTQPDARNTMTTTNYNSNNDLQHNSPSHLSVYKNNTSDTDTNIYDNTLNNNASNLKSDANATKNALADQTSSYPLQTQLLTSTTTSTTTNSKQDVAQINIPSSILTFQMLMYLVELTIQDYVFINAAHSQLPFSSHRAQCLHQIRTTLLLKLHTPLSSVSLLPLTPTQHSALAQLSPAFTGNNLNPNITIGITYNTSLHKLDTNIPYINSSRSNPILTINHTQTNLHQASQISQTTLGSGDSYSSHQNVSNFQVFLQTPTPQQLYHQQHTHQCTRHYITVVEALCNPVSSTLVTIDTLRIVLWFLQDADCPILHNCTAKAFYNNNKDINMRLIASSLISTFHMSPFPFFFLLRFMFTLFPSPSPLCTDVFKYTTDYTLHLLKETVVLNPIDFYDPSLTHNHTTAPSNRLSYRAQSAGPLSMTLQGPRNDIPVQSTLPLLSTFSTQYTASHYNHAQTQPPPSHTQNSQNPSNLPQINSDKNSTTQTQPLYYRSILTPTDMLLLAPIPTTLAQKLSLPDLWFIAHQYRYYDHALLFRTFNPRQLCTTPFNVGNLHFLTLLLTTGCVQYYLSYDHIRSTLQWPFHPYLREYHSYMRFEFQTFFPQEIYTTQFDLQAHELTCLNTTVAMTISQGQSPTQLIDLVTKSNNIFPFIPTINPLQSTPHLSSTLLTHFQTHHSAYYTFSQSSLPTNYLNLVSEAQQHGHAANTSQTQLPSQLSPKSSRRRPPTAHTPLSSPLPTPNNPSPTTDLIPNPNYTNLPLIQLQQTAIAEILSSYWRKFQQQTHRLMPLAFSLFLPCNGGPKSQLLGNLSFNGSTGALRFQDITSILPYLPWYQAHPELTIQVNHSGDIGDSHQTSSLIISAPNLGQNQLAAVTLTSKQQPQQDNTTTTSQKDAHSDEKQADQSNQPPHQLKRQSSHGNHPNLHQQSVHATIQLSTNTTPLYTPYDLHCDADQYQRDQNSISTPNSLTHHLTPSLSSSSPTHSTPHINVSGNKTVHKHSPPQRLARHLSNSSNHPQTAPTGPPRFSNQEHTFLTLRQHMYNTAFTCSARFAGTLKETAPFFTLNSSSATNPTTPDAKQNQLTNASNPKQSITITTSSITNSSKSTPSQPTSSQLVASSKITPVSTTTGALDPTATSLQLEEQLHLHSTIFSTLFSTGLVWTLFSQSNQTVSFIKELYTQPSPMFKREADSAQSHSLQLTLPAYYHTNQVQPVFQQHAVIWLYLLNYYSLYYTNLHQQIVSHLNTAFAIAFPPTFTPMPPVHNNTSGPHHNLTNHVIHHNMNPYLINSINPHGITNEDASLLLVKPNNSNTDTNYDSIPPFIQTGPISTLSTISSSIGSKPPSISPSNNINTSSQLLFSSSQNPSQSSSSNPQTAPPSIISPPSVTTSNSTTSPSNRDNNNNNNNNNNTQLSHLNNSLSLAYPNHYIPSKHRLLAPTFTRPQALARHIEGYLTLIPPLHPSTFAPTLLSALYKISNQAISRVQYRLAEYKKSQKQLHLQQLAEIIPSHATHNTHNFTQFNRTNINTRNFGAFGGSAFEEDHSHHYAATSTGTDNNDEWTHFTELIKPLATVRLTVFEYFCMMLCYGALCYTDERCFDPKNDTLYIYSNPNDPKYHSPVSTTPLLASHHENNLYNLHGADSEQIQHHINNSTSFDHHTAMNNFPSNKSALDQYYESVGGLIGSSSNFGQQTHSAAQNHGIALSIGPTVVQPILVPKTSQKDRDNDNSSSASKDDKKSSHSHSVMDKDRDSYHKSRNSQNNNKDRDLSHKTPTTSQKPLPPSNHPQSPLNHSVFDISNVKNLQVLKFPPLPPSSLPFHEDILALQTICPTISNHAEIDVNYHIIHSICSMPNEDRINRMKQWHNFSLSDFLPRMWRQQQLHQRKLTQFIAKMRAATATAALGTSSQITTKPTATTTTITAPMLEKKIFPAAARPPDSSESPSNPTNTIDTANSMNNNFPSSLSTVSTTPSMSPSDITRKTIEPPVDPNLTFVSDIPSLAACMQGIDSSIITPEISALYAMKQQHLHNTFKSAGAGTVGTSGVKGTTITTITPKGAAPTSTTPGAIDGAGGSSQTTSTSDQKGPNNNNNNKNNNKNVVSPCFENEPGSEPQGHVQLLFSQKPLQSHSAGSQLISATPNTHVSGPKHKTVFEFDKKTPQEPPSPLSKPPIGRIQSPFLTNSSLDTVELKQTQLIDKDNNNGLISHVLKDPTQLQSALLFSDPVHGSSSSPADHNPARVAVNKRKAEQAPNQHNAIAEQAPFLACNQLAPTSSDNLHNSAGDNCTIVESPPNPSGTDSLFNPRDEEARTFRNAQQSHFYKSLPPAQKNVQIDDTPFDPQAEYDLEANYSLGLILFALECVLKPTLQDLKPLLYGLTYDPTSDLIHYSNQPIAIQPLSPDDGDESDDGLVGIKVTSKQGHNRTINNSSSSSSSNTTNNSKNSSVALYAPSVDRTAPESPQNRSQLKNDPNFNSKPNLDAQQDRVTTTIQLCHQSRKLFKHIPEHVLYLLNDASINGYAHPLQSIHAILNPSTIAPKPETPQASQSSSPNTLPPHSRHFPLTPSNVSATPPSEQLSPLLSARPDKQYLLTNLPHNNSDDFADDINHDREAPPALLARNCNRDRDHDNKSHKTNSSRDTSKKSNNIFSDEPKTPKSSQLGELLRPTAELGNVLQSGALHSAQPQAKPTLSLPKPFLQRAAVLTPKNQKNGPSKESTTNANALHTAVLPSIPLPHYNASSIPPISAPYTPLLMYFLTRALIRRAPESILLSLLDLIFTHYPSPDPTTSNVFTCSETNHNIDQFIINKWTTPQFAAGIKYLLQYQITYGGCGLHGLYLFDLIDICLTFDYAPRFVQVLETGLFNMYYPPLEMYYPPV